MNDELMIEASGISKVYWDGTRPLEILKKISLSVKRGEGVAILGPSGSGKTTLLNMLSGLDTPNEGEVRLGGTVMSKLSEGDRAAFRNQNIGFIFQFYHLLSEFTALENILLPSLMRRGGFGAEARGRAMELLGRVGLKDRATHFPSELSGGEQQRIAIARALMNEPKILFCDEPTGNLDRKMAREIADLLRSLFKQENRTVVIVTHDEQIASMADRVMRLGEGNWERKDGNVS